MAHFINDVELFMRIYIGLLRIDLPLMSQSLNISKIQRTACKTGKAASSSPANLL